MERGEQRELKALLNRLQQFELRGDVGRMIFLALENATDEREQKATSHRLAGFRGRAPLLRLGRLRDALLRERPRG